MNVTHLECANCHKIYEANKLHNLCVECAKPLLVRYDLAKAAQTLTKESLKNRGRKSLAIPGSFAGRKRGKHRQFRRRLHADFQKSNASPRRCRSN